METAPWPSLWLCASWGASARSRSFQFLLKQFLLISIVYLTWLIHIYIYILFIMIYAASSSQREERDGALTINCIIHIHTPLKDDVSTAQTSSTPAVDPIKPCHRLEVFVPSLRTISAIGSFLLFLCTLHEEGWVLAWAPSCTPLWWWEWMNDVKI